jgi:hypothetical protein
MPKRGQWWAAWGALLPAIWFCVSPAHAHDWYPRECCSGLDCAPVEKVEMLPGPAIANMLSAPAQASQLGAMLVTTRHGSVVVPADFPRRESKDNRMHACMRTDVTGVRLLCLFLPPPS